jgi:serine/threonine-protein kinase
VGVIGRVLEGRYELTRLIGLGGMGEVYEGRHTGTKRRVAIKLISEKKKKPVHIKRFKREARAAGGIFSRHICQVFDIGSDEESGRLYIAMELLEGEDLGQLIKRVGPLPPRTAVAIAVQLCRGLQKAHEAGVIHRDIKPGNIFLAEQDGEVVAKLLDFGIAKMNVDQLSKSEHNLTRSGALMGSPLYMSPEQARGGKKVDERADIWSLGVVLYRALCGRAPLQHVEALGELVIAVCSEPPPPVSDYADWVDAELAEAVAAALRLDKEQRYGSAADMGLALESFIQGEARLTPDDLKGVDAEHDGLPPAQSLAEPPTRSDDDSAPSGTGAAVSGAASDEGAGDEGVSDDSRSDHDGGSAEPDDESRDDEHDGSVQAVDGGAAFDGRAEPTPSAALSAASATAAEHRKRRLMYIYIGCVVLTLGGFVYAVRSAHVQSRGGTGMTVPETDAPVGLPPATEPAAPDEAREPPLPSPLASSPGEEPSPVPDRADAGPLPMISPRARALPHMRAAASAPSAAASATGTSRQPSPTQPVAPPPPPAPVSPPATAPPAPPPPATAPPAPPPVAPPPVAPPPTLP